MSKLSDCPLCGRPCKEAYDGDSNDLIVCTESGLATSPCNYEVYAECHEAICAEVARLREALRNYGHHLSRCPKANVFARHWERQPCECGLDAALAKPEQECAGPFVDIMDCPKHRGDVLRAKPEQEARK